MKLKKIALLLIALVIILFGLSSFKDQITSQPMVFTEPGQNIKYDSPCPTILKSKLFDRDDTELIYKEMRKALDFRTKSIEIECNNYTFFP